MDKIMGPGLYNMDCMEAMKQFTDGFCAPRGTRKGDEGSMEELMALLRTIAGGIQNDEARHVLFVFAVSLICGLIASLFHHR